MKPYYKILLLALIIAMIHACGGAGPSSPPIIPVSIESLDGEADVGVDSSFTYEFEKELDASTVTDDTFFLVPTPAESSISLPSKTVFKAAVNPTICNPASENKVDATLSISSQTTTYTPTSNLSYGTSYTFCITDALTFSDQTSFEGFMATFTTETASSNLPGGATTSTPTISSVKDASSTTIQTTGSTGIAPTSLNITFSEAMDETSITTAGNITLTCGAASPTITVTRSADNTARVAVTDAYKYALHNCTLTITTNVKNSGGTAIASNATYAFTNGCALDDDFNADSQSCWTVDDLTSPWASWAELLADGTLTFNTSGSTLDHDGSTQLGSLITLNKTVSLDSSEFEVIIHFKSVTGYDAGGATELTEQSAFAQLDNGNADPVLNQLMLFGIANIGLTQYCFTEFWENGARVDNLWDACPTGEYYIKFGVNATGLVHQYSTDGNTYNNYAGPGAGFPARATYLSNFASSATLSLIMVNQLALIAGDATIDSITTTGLSSTSQY